MAKKKKTASRPPEEEKKELYIPSSEESSPVQSTPAQASPSKQTDIRPWSQQDTPQLKGACNLLSVLGVIGVALILVGLWLMLQKHTGNVLTKERIGTALVMVGFLFAALPEILAKTAPKKSQDPQFEFTFLNDKLRPDVDALLETLQQAGLPAAPPLPKALKKTIDNKLREETKQVKEADSESLKNWSAEVEKRITEGESPTKVLLSLRKPRAYVLEYSGDLAAEPLSLLRDAVTLVLTVSGPNDVFVLKLTSPGGLVSAYGLASAQLARLRHRKIRIVVCVDTVAASGGYMMACVADEIVAAPFSVVGSIGVVAGMPNVARWLKTRDIDYHLFTAGKYKRTVTPFSEVTEEGKAKFQTDLTRIHDAFKTHIQTYRPQVNLDHVATGEFWLATQAVPLKLVDTLATSDEYLWGLTASHHVFEIKLKPKRPLGFLSSLLASASASVGQWASRVFSSWISSSSPLSAAAAAASASPLGLLEQQQQYQHQYQAVNPALWAVSESMPLVGAASGNGWGVDAEAPTQHKDL